MERSESKTRVYRLRKKNFQNRLVQHLSHLGFVLLIIRYLKFGGWIWFLLLRCVVQAYLTRPFPSNEQLRMYSELGLGFRYLQDGDTMPEDRIPEMKIKLRRMLLYISFSLNIAGLLYAIGFPVQTLQDFNSETSRLDKFRNIPSNFVNGKGLIQGERRSGLIFRIIGESLPESFVVANLESIFYHLGITIVQSLLFSLTCVELADLDTLNDSMAPNVADSQSDGYDGKVLAATIDPIKSIDTVLHSSHNIDSIHNSV